MRVRSGFNYPREGPLTGSCEHGNEGAYCVTSLATISFPRNNHLRCFIPQRKSSVILKIHLQRSYFYFPLKFRNKNVKTFFLSAFRSPVMDQEVLLTLKKTDKILMRSFNIDREKILLLQTKDVYVVLYWRSTLKFVGEFKFGLYRSNSIHTSHD